MYTSLPNPIVSYSNALRWCARASGVFLMVSWVVLFGAEAIRQGLDKPAMNTAGQGVALAVVFAGYVLGWWKEYAGGALAILGMFAFFAIVIVTSHAPPDPAAVWFAAPGALSLFSHFYSEQRANRLTR